MKKVVLTFVLLFSISFQISAQWYAITTPYTNNFNAVYFVDKNTGWICADSGLILHTTNRGIDWIEQQSGTTENLHDIKFCSSNIGWAVGTIGTILKTTDSGITWNPQLSGITSQLNSISVLDSENVKIVGYEGKFLMTTNGGVLWNVIQFGNMYNYGLSVFFLNNNLGWLCGYIFDPAFTYIYAVYKTQNGGNTWQFVKSDFGISSDVFFVNENYGWVAGFFQKIMVTTDGGNSWVFKNFSSDYYSNRVFLIREGIGWITNYWESNAIRFTSDGGNTWSLQAQAASRFSGINFVEQKYGCAVGMAGLILQTDNGGGVFPTTPILISPENNRQLVSDTVNLIWSSATPQITNYEVYLSTDSLFSNTIDTLVTDTTILFSNLEINTQYYWKVKAKNEIGSGDESEIFSFITTLTDIKDNEVIPFNFFLSQNYPNPFNPSTKISWQSPVGSWQTLKVYDILGNEVVTLVNEYKDAGSYEIEFKSSVNSHHLASGIYYYQLRAGDYVQTKKMVLMK